MRFRGWRPLTNCDPPSRPAFGYLELLDFSSHTLWTHSRIWFGLLPGFFFPKMDSLTIVCTLSCEGWSWGGCLFVVRTELGPAGLCAHTCACWPFAVEVGPRVGRSEGSHGSESRGHISPWFHVLTQRFGNLENSKFKCGLPGHCEDVFIGARKESV